MGWVPEEREPDGESLHKNVRKILDTTRCIGRSELIEHVLHLLQGFAACLRCFGLNARLTTPELVNLCDYLQRVSVRSKPLQRQASCEAFALSVPLPNILAISTT